MSHLKFSKWPPFSRWPPKITYCTCRWGVWLIKLLLNYYVECKQRHFDLFFIQSYLGGNKMATTFKMVALNVLFRRRSSLLVNCFKNGESNFKIGCKSGIKLQLVK